MKLLVLAWSADCEENNKQAMLKLIQEKTGGTLPPKLHFLLPIPEATHVAKCLKGSFSNWFLNKGGERFNLSNLRTLYNDPNPAMREKMRSVVTLSAVRNRDRMSVPDLLTINKESVRVLLASVPRITQTLIPEPYRLYKGNARGVVDHPTGLCIAPEGKLFVADNSKSRVFQGRLHYPVDVSEVSDSLMNPPGLAYLNNVLYVADMGNKRVAYLPLSSSVFLKPNSMKVSELRPALEERQIPTAGLQKKDMVARLKEWMTKAQRENKVDCTKFSSLPLNTARSTPLSTPLAVCGFGTDLLFISDLHTHRVLQVSITNNGAVLKGSVISEILLKDSALPLGISVATGNLLVADSSDEGGLLRIDLSTNAETVLVSNKSSSCQRIHGIAVDENGDLIFTDRDARKLRLLSNGTVKDIAGSGVNSSKDGSSSSCSFEQPTAVCIEGKTIYVADTAVGRVCMVTPTSALSLYLEQTDTVCKTFGIHLPGISPNIYSISQAIAAFRDVSSLLSTWERETAESLCRASTVQGPQGTPSSKSIQSVKVILESLGILKESLSYINADFISHVRLASLLTLVVEHLFSKMRSRNPTPTLLEYAQLFGPTMKENVKQLTKCGFHYFTASSSFYELPDGGSLHFTDVPVIPQLPTKSMPIGDQKVLRDWRDNYGQPVAQVTVRNQSTKDNVGTLPLYSYTRPQPIPQPPSFSFPTETSSSRQGSLHSNVSNAELLFSSQTVLAIKPGLVGLTERTLISTPFYLGVAAENIYQDQHRAYLPKINIFYPSEQNIYLFERNDQVDLPKEAVGLVLDALTPAASEEIILPEEIYEGVVSVFRETRDLCIEGDESITDSVADEADFSDDELNSVVCVDSVTLPTISTSRVGRNIRPPTRLDL